MTIYRCILPDYARNADPTLPKVREGQFTSDEIVDLNAAGYNIYYLPNYPKNPPEDMSISGSQIDTFEYVFVDMDLKDGYYPTKEAFLHRVFSLDVPPSRIVDSGGGIHVYWRVVDLDAMSYLRLSRRLMRTLHTDEAVGQIFQLMRCPDTVNTKDPENFRICEILDETDATYTCEQLDALLPSISAADEAYCKQHYDKTHKIVDKNHRIDDKIPLKFAQLVRNNKEVKEIWEGGVDDRSGSDFRLGHIMFGSGFTREEALSVLVNCAKALARSPVHRMGYAENIVDKIWTYEIVEEANKLELSDSVLNILKGAGDNIKGTRVPCYRWVDDTEKGFRLGQVMGLVAGVGVGKTAFALNLFMGFVESNPNLDHFFVPLEQPANEIAERWASMCGSDKTHLHAKVQVLSNYDAEGGYRNLSLQEIEDYIVKYQRVTGRKVGAVVIDHIGVLKKKTKDGENQGIMDICHAMKAFAIKTQTYLIMQSQAPREKAGIGDLELDKDAAYGTVFFESYCDYMVTLWQPAKRCYKDGALTVTAFKFCKIRHKKQNKDKIIEDNPYLVLFDPETQRMRQLTQDEEKNVAFFIQQATNARKQDRKTDLVTYTAIQFEQEKPA